MKTVRVKSGSFQERPHFEPAEIDRICVDELRKAGYYPTSPGPIRIDRFIEKRFGRPHDYEDLPLGILGYTKFSKNGVDRIVISRALAEDDGDVTRRRERATMAHEAGHGLLHAYYFALETSTKLFGAQDATGPQILCREVLTDRSAASAKTSWSEFQANRAIGGLLLPRRLVVQVAAPYLVVAGSLGGSTIDPSRRRDAERAVSSIFDVNPIVAKIRLDEIYPPKTGQMEL